jgi:hypothetical protein
LQPEFPPPRRGFATIRTTEWTEFFTAKRGHAVAAITSDNFDSGFVNELHDVPFCIP